MATKDNNTTMYQVNAFIKAGAKVGGPATDLACFADPWVTLNIYRNLGWVGVRKLTSEVRRFRSNA